MNTSFNRNGLSDVQTVDYTQTSAIESHKVLRNTYMLLSITLLFSALCAAASVALALPSFGFMITLAGYFGLFFLTTKFRNSGWGLPCVFALTGFMGLTLGPMVSHYLKMPGGSGIVMGALGLTGAIFLGLSAVALVTRRNFSFMGSFLMIGMIVMVVASLAAFFLQIPALHLAISAAVVLLMSGMILYETSNIIHGGETNYIMATVSLYLTIFNLFTSLMQLLGFINED